MVKKRSFKKRSKRIKKYKSRVRRLKKKSTKRRLKGG